MDVAALTTMAPARLRQVWRQVYRSPPPQFTADLLARSIAYRHQEKRQGGLSRGALRELARVAARGAATASRGAGSLKPGTRLVRSWNGTTHAVLVTEEGFLFEQRAYRSLSAIASEITGTRWSGPRFFGLTKRG